MKKIILKKEVIARINDSEMSNLKGGQSDNACANSRNLPCPSQINGTCPSPTPSPNTCGTAWTCNG